jgi:hypothetical protein
MSWRASTDVFGCNFSSNKALIQEASITRLVSWIRPPRGSRSITTGRKTPSGRQIIVTPVVFA